MLRIDGQQMFAIPFSRLDVFQLVICFHSSKDGFLIVRGNAERFIAIDHTFFQISQLELALGPVQVEDSTEATIAIGINGLRVESDGSRKIGSGVAFVALGFVDFCTILFARCGRFRLTNKINIFYIFLLQIQIIESNKFVNI